MILTRVVIPASCTTWFSTMRSSSRLQTPRLPENERLPPSERAERYSGLPHDGIRQALLSKDLKDFLIGLAMSWIMEKEGGGLDAKAVTTVKLRGNYKGKAPVMQARAAVVADARSLLQNAGPLLRPVRLSPSSLSFSGGAAS